MRVELYKWTPTNTRYWSALGDYFLGCIYIEHGVLGGAMQQQTESVEVNQSGRSIEEQVDLQILARAKKKEDIGYRMTVEASKKASGDNTMGLKRPMLAKRLDQLTDVDFSDCYLQSKYDGHRCLVTRTSTGLVAYSRNGRPIKTIDHILDGIKIPVGMTLDGELYQHNSNLQSISSWVKKKQLNTMNLEYIVYDVIQEQPYNVRYNTIRNLDFNRYTKVAPTDTSVEENHIPMLLENAIALGFEGLMLRQCRFPYEVGKRSKALVKVKAFLDDEFQVVGVEESKDGWAILLCQTRHGERFYVSAPGTHEEKTEVLRNHGKYVGKRVTVQYANLTEDGIPFHPVAVGWR